MPWLSTLCKRHMYMYFTVKSKSYNPVMVNSYFDRNIVIHYCTERTSSCQKGNKINKRGERLEGSF